MPKVNIFLLGNDHYYTLHKSTKNCANWMRASCWFLCLKKSAITFGEGCIHWKEIPSFGIAKQIPITFELGCSSSLFAVCASLNTVDVVSYNLICWIIMKWWQYTFVLSNKQLLSLVNVKHMFLVAPIVLPMWKYRILLPFGCKRFVCISWLRAPFNSMV